jgi:hypothetical protein
MATPEEIIERMEATYGVSTSELVTSGLFFIKAVDLDLWRLAWKLTQGVALDETDRANLKKYGVKNGE